MDPRYRYPKNPTYRPYLDSFIFFIKIALACSLFAACITFGYKTLPIYQNSWIYLPLLLSVSHAFIYYLWGYVVFTLYENDYFIKYKQPVSRKITKQKMDWQVWGVIKGEVIGFLMNCFFLFLAVKIGGMKYDYQSVSQVYKNPYDFCKLFAWYFFAMWWADLTFFTAHYWFHSSPWAYRVIHKKHHSFQYQVGWSAEVKTLTESVLVSSLEFIPHILLGGHFVHFLAWILVQVVYNIENHSGYNIFFVKTYGFHNWHHYRNDGNYGLAVYLDHLFNTSTKWINWIEDYPDKQTDDAKKKL